MGMIITRTNEDDNAHQEAAEQEKKELIEALVVKTKMEEEEVGIDIRFVLIVMFLFFCHHDIFIANKNVLIVNVIIATDLSLISTPLPINDCNLEKVSNFHNAI